MIDPSIEGFFIWYNYGMTNKKYVPVKYSGPFEVVGRDVRIDMSRYTVTVLGRELVDYDKLRRENPQLHKEILDNENRQDLLEEDI